MRLLSSTSAETHTVGQTHTLSKPSDDGSDITRIQKKQRGADLLFLVVVVAVSFSPFVTRLGFSSDDWGFLGVLSNSQDQSVLGLTRYQYQENDVLHLRARPTQMLSQSLLYRVFGLDPLGYHLFNAALFAGIAITAYGVLCELRVHRIVAISIPAIFILLPNYSTNRFWFAAFGYSISVLLYLLSLWADLRTIRSAGKQRMAWTISALAVMLLAGFGYEAVLPLFILNLLICHFYSRRSFAVGLVGRLGRSGATVLIGGHLAVLGLIVAYKIASAEFIGTPSGGAFLHLRRLFFGSLLTNAGSYGLGLLHTAWWGIRRVDAWVLIIGVCLAAVIFIYLVRTNGEAGGRPRLGVPRRVSIQLVLAGAVIFVLGYSIFVGTGRITFTSTGIGNRVAMVPALGMAAALVGIVGIVSSQFRTGSRRLTCFAVLIAALAFSSFVISGALADFWVKAWREERAVLTEIDKRLPHLQRNNTLLVHGICPYIGPAVVFESSWDLAGALKARRRDPTLRADVTGRMTFGDDAVVSTVYGDWVSTYRYGKRLLLYDRDANAVVTISDAATARRYFGTERPEVPSSCPVGFPGKGEELLPFDRLYARLEFAGFWP